jgi:hypothetical protein
MTKMTKMTPSEEKKRAEQRQQFKEAVAKLPKKWQVKIGLALEKRAAQRHPPPTIGQVAEAMQNRVWA